MGVQFQNHITPQPASLCIVAGGEEARCFSTLQNGLALQRCRCLHQASSWPAAVAGAIVTRRRTHVGVRLT